ncbi:protein O-mannosyl-transferase 2-like isoform X2 [Bolinopsis microptera]
MVIAGASVGCIISVKYIGVFTVLYIGFLVIEDIWRMISDNNYNLKDVAIYFGAFASFFIILPAVLYILFFVLHFRFTLNSTDADSTYSPAFQASLIGNKVTDVKNSQYLSYQNTVRFKTGNFLLHSHHLTYPDIGLNQVTGYGHRDENNKWEVERCLSTPGYGDSVIVSGDMIQLRHIATGRYLSVLPDVAGVTDLADNRVVTTETSDLNSCLQVTTSDLTHKFKKIETFQTDVVMFSLNNKCALKIGKKKLPEYGAKQLEVTCTRRHVRNPALVHFTLEHNISPVEADNVQGILPAGFFSKLYEMQIKMLVTNNALLPSEEEPSSRPWMWPVNWKGLWFALSHQHGGVYFLGNPVIFWTNLVMIFVLLAINIIQAYSQLRDRELPYKKAELYQSNWYLFGYLLHYLPFYLMGRILYFHHFYSAFIFNCMLTGGVVELLLAGCSSAMRIRGALLLVIFLSFIAFAPLAYGIPVDEDHKTYGYIKWFKWLSTWGF